ncbi:MAG TPA: hypothetical protein V6C95_02070 [Coleofasciculaceae cyanobacterium]
MDSTSFRFLNQELITGYQVTQFVNQNLENLSWKEVLWFAAGLISEQAEELLFKLEQKAQKFLNTFKLRNLLHWVTQVVDSSEDNFKPAAKRAEALRLVMNRASNLARARARGSDRIPALARAHDLDEAAIHAGTIIQKLENSTLTKNEQSAELSRAFTNRIVQTWYDGLFDPYLLDLSKGETRSLKNYLYTNELIIRCKTSAVVVSQKTWDELENRMLLVIAEDE